MKKSRDDFVNSVDSAFEESSCFSEATDTSLSPREKATLLLWAKWALLVLLLSVLVVLSAYASGNRGTLVNESGTAVLPWLAYGTPAERETVSIRPVEGPSDPHSAAGGSIDNVVNAMSGGNRLLGNLISDDISRRQGLISRRGSEMAASGPSSEKVA